MNIGLVLNARGKMCMVDEMNNYLLKINKILIIRMENKKPVEGYDTSFLRLKDKKVID